MKYNEILIMQGKGDGGSVPERTKRAKIPHQFINQERDNERKIYKIKPEKRRKNWCGVERIKG